MYRQHRQTENIIRKSGFFDNEYYLRVNPDVSSAGVDPLSHYLRRGRYEGRSPSPDFDPNFYLISNPDVAQSGLDPVAHFITNGRDEGRSTLPPCEIILRSGLFDGKFYRAAYLDVALAGCDPLHHYVDHGRREGRRPSLDFDPAVYLASNPDLQRTEIDPITHFIQSGRSEGRRCRYSGLTMAELPLVIAQIRSSNLFKDVFYLRQCPSVEEAGVDAIYHYLFGGFAKYVDPSSNFSTLDYIRAHPEVRSSETNPLLHFLQLRQPNEETTQRIRVPGPQQQVEFERNASVVYSRRYLLGVEAARPSKYVREAIEDLASTPVKDNLTDPHVSIIVPVFGQMRHVLNCLDSLRRQHSRYRNEIIIVDASPPIAQTRDLQAIPWVRYESSKSQVGFMEACKLGARTARSNFLVFLNSRTRVAEGWLDELIDSFHQFPRAGLIGSKLFNQDGSLREAGGFYRADGVAWHCGKGADGHHPRYCYAREADFLSGVSVAIRADEWDRFKSAETFYRSEPSRTDLCSQLRAAGYEIWMQSLSCVICCADEAATTVLTRTD